MYTQCPECFVAFRVTADVLKQAAGKVRCGGCGVPFNALAHLSEEKPQDRTRREPEEPVPQLTPELPVEPDDQAKPRTISAEQSAALLKTLDQLAGEDVRIEDTGVEWRVLDDIDIQDDTPDVLDTRGDIQAPEEPEPSGHAEELRFDDNTPLPDDFDLESEPAYTAPADPPPEEDSGPPAEAEIGQVDLAFGDPDEWEDLLGEVAEPDVEEIEEEVRLPAEVDEARPADDEPDADAASPEPAEDQPLDMDTQFALQAEALGVDLSGLHESIPDEPGEEIELASPVDDEHAETSIDQDLIAAAFEAEATARKEVSAAEELLEELADADESMQVSRDLDGMPEFEEPRDLEKTEEPEAEGPEAEEPEGEELDPEAIEAAGNLDLEAIELELSTDDDGDIVAGAPEIDDADLEAVLAMAAEDELEEAELETEEPSALDLATELEAALDGEDPGEAPESDFEQEPAEELVDEEELDVPPQTEEEMTINMMIDQDLLAIAVEDDDGFTSTIVQKQVSGKHDIPEEKIELGTGDDVADDEANATAIPPEFSNALVETIIMEGESISGEFDADKEAAKADLMAQAREAVRNHDQEGDQRSNSANIRNVAGIALLLLLLVAQILHQYREELATVPAFSNSIAPLYRSIGRPITPAWSVGGWRIEASKGSADEDNQELTIYSRVGNMSETALPYPLMQISLTDRFAETIGSRVLEPADYLVGDSDPRRKIEPGDTFDAVITVRSPSPDSTGYDLKPCYRLDDGQLRCKIEDFK